jgi:hypothetical protein
VFDQSPVQVLPQPGWVLSLYPDAAEAGGCFVNPFRRHSVGIKGRAVDPERSRAEAARRARGKLRRYCAANGLNRLGTLTYAPPFCTDPQVLRSDVGVFFRQLRSLLGDESLPYAWVPELHKDGERFHVHFAVGRFVPRGLIEQAWGHGFVHIKLLSGLPVGSGAVAEARVAAGYLSKYVGKAIDSEASGKRPFGLHRYEVAQGFQPLKQRFAATTVQAVFHEACEVMGGRPSLIWESSDVDDWAAAPAVWLQWGGR